MASKCYWPKKSDAPTQGQLPAPPVQFGVGGLIGAASAIFGIGGGKLYRAVFKPIWFDHATSGRHFSGMWLADCDCRGARFMFFGKDVQGLPPDAIGFVHITASCVFR